MKGTVGRTKISCVTLGHGAVVCRRAGVEQHSAGRSRGGGVITRAAAGSREDLSSEGVVKATRRGALSAGVGLLSAAIFPSTAFALLPDDDDEELIRRAKEKRKTKLKEELATERNFVGLSKPTEDEIKTVQLAVAKMVKTGSLLEEGNLDAAANVIGTSSTPWATQLTSLARRKSAGKAEEPAGMMLSSLSVLQQSVMNGDDRKARSSFAATASAMQEFVDAVGMTGSIKGL
ncbi:hypothetical protein HOP50_12g67160 [Chloropicon primus]|uniref:Maintenance of Photosystem II under High light 2 C-terminal domain-containing protein n=1 Tax=Chloropicon primus TaxID=1764295 RepID=A0A5B8MUC7_9CHLO|nr:hypothetical protein A3770_12p66970 [Chloropicon primus]UPR03387.1 hypothetical protein HOP50_12g67160 [Chloropicon primus]|eukprot:QDZ24179.1 hypothetical protein A3770_12p66970 [Chloropicon primus]